MSDKIHVHICYGLLFERDFEFPWREDDWEEWWYRQQEGYPVDARYEEREAWREKVGVFPPFKAIDCCLIGGNGCKRIILAVPSSVQDADWWEPIPFDPERLFVNGLEISRLREFVAKHIPDAPPFAPRWYASAYLG